MISTESLKVIAASLEHDIEGIVHTNIGAAAPESSEWEACAGYTKALAEVAQELEGRENASAEEPEA